MLHKYFSFTLFCRELHVLREGATPANATEREFELALSRTSASCANLFAARNMANSYHYKGPQSWSHRQAPEKMKVEPEHAPQRPLLSEKRATGKFGGLVCSLCDKTRRVDASTFNVFHNDTWLSESVALRKEAFYCEAPDFDDDLRSWFQEAAFEHENVFSLLDFERFFSQSQYQHLR